MTKLASLHLLEGRRGCELDEFGTQPGEDVERAVVGRQTSTVDGPVPFAHDTETKSGGASVQATKESFASLPIVGHGQR